MKRIALVWLIASALDPVHAQSFESGNVEFTVQQQRLDAQRQAAAQQADEENRACIDRFAVNDCLKAARSRNLERTADIRRQQEHLNALQRQQRGEEKVRQQKEKMAQREQELRDTAARADARAESNQNGKGGEPRHPVRGTEPVSPPAGAADSATVRSPPAATGSREEHQRKLQEAEKRRLDRDKRLLEQTKSKRPAPLPAAP